MDGESPFFVAKKKACANIYNVWNARDYWCCDLIGPYRISVIVTNAGIRMSADLPVLRVKVWLARLTATSKPYRYLSVGMLHPLNGPTYQMKALEV